MSDDERLLEEAQNRIDRKRESLQPAITLDPIGIGELGEDGFPASMADWPEWPCYGCKDSMRAPAVPERRDFTSTQAYIQAKCCSTCAPGMLSKWLPRAEILSLAGVPRFERSVKWDPEKAKMGTAFPRDERLPGYELEDWPTKNGPASVVLCGKNGVGKTMLSTQLLVQAFRTGVRSLGWFTADELVAEHFALDSWETKPKALRAARCGCLVLDEYGRGQHSNEFAYGLIGSILDQRKHALTVITSNLAFSSAGNGKSFEETDSAVFDRLTDGLVIQMLGESKRGRR